MLVDFYADWCGPCRLVEPHLKKLAAESDSVTVMKARLEECPAFTVWLQEQGQAFKLGALPTCVLFDGGKPVRKMEGAFSFDKLDAFVAGTGVSAAVPAPAAAAPDDAGRKIAAVLPGLLILSGMGAVALLS